MNIFFNWEDCIYAMSGTLHKMFKVWVKYGGMVKISYYILLDVFELFQGLESGEVFLDNKIHFMLNIYLKYKVTEWSSSSGVGPGPNNPSL